MNCYACQPNNPYSCKQCSTFYQLKSLNINNSLTCIENIQELKFDECSRQCKLDKCIKGVTEYKCEECVKGYVAIGKQCYYDQSGQMKESQAQMGFKKEIQTFIKGKIQGINKKNWYKSDIFLIFVGFLTLCICFCCCCCGCCKRSKNNEESERKKERKREKMK